MVVLKINSNIEYEVVDFNVSLFNINYSLTLNTDDLRTVKESLSTISKIEIIDNGILIYDSDSFDTYETITLEKYVARGNDGFFKDGLRVKFTKKDLVAQVKKLDEQINPIVDTESMTLDEYKTYIKSKIGAVCQQQIFDGADVTFENGDMKHYSYTIEDQNNLTNALNIILQGVPGVPYHADNEGCKVYTALELATVYTTLQTMLTKKTTYCNMLNIYIKGLQTKEEVGNVTWGMELPDDLQKQMDSIIEISNQIVQEIIDKFNK